jgi:hypothetical protein
VTGSAGGGRLAGYLIRRACRRLPEDIGAERYREWAAELAAIADDPEIRLAPVRAARALGFAVGICTSARLLSRPDGRGSSRLPRGVILAAGAIIIWVAAVEVSSIYPLDGSWGYLYVAAGGVSETLAIVAVVRAIRWFARLFSHTPRS